MSISVRDLSVSVQGRKLLHKVEFDCSAGELVAIVGENGAGKSTLLNAIAGLTQPEYGSVLINGQHVGSYSKQALAKVRAVLPQSSALSFPLSVTEIVRLGMCFNRVSRNQQDQIIQSCLAEVDAEQVAHREYLTLSGGEKQRVQLARVLAQLQSADSEAQTAPVSRFLLLDEPTSALDLAHQYDMLALLQRLSQKRIGVVVIVHDLNTASLFSDKIVILKNGQIVKVGSPENVFSEGVLKHAFNIDVTVGTHPDKNKPYLIPRLR